jgi:hypothetical protein
MIMAKGIQHATAQQIPRREIAIEACKTAPSISNGSHPRQEAAYLKYRPNEKCRDHDQNKKNKGGGPDVPQHEWHSRQLQGSALPSGLSLPLPYNLPNTGEFHILIFIFFFGKEAAVALI